MQTPDYAFHLPQRCAAQSWPVHATVRSSTGRGSYAVYATASGGDCTCPGWRFQGKCKHMAHVRAQACSWGMDSPVVQTLRQNIDMVCPSCGGPTALVEQEKEQAA